MEEKEQKIIMQCQQGNLDQFAILYDKYIKNIYDFIYYKTMHQEITEDLTSRTFIKALNKINTFEIKKGNFKAWIYRIARNTVIDYYRSKKQETNIETIWDLGTKESIINEIDNKITLDKINKYLINLNKKQREIIIMRLWDGLTYQEISLITKETEVNCRMIVSRGLKKIKQNIIISIGLIIIYSILWTNL